MLQTKIIEKNHEKFHFFYARLSICMDILFMIITLAVSVMFALYWGAIWSVRLPEIDSRFDRKPFNCRPCFTFHLSWMLSTFFALVSESWELFSAGIVIAFIVFFIIKFIDSKKIEK